MSHSIEEARNELAAAREAGRGPAGWALEIAEGTLAREGAVGISEADLDALDDAVFGKLAELGRPSVGASERGAGAVEASEAYLDELDDAVFGRPGRSVVDGVASEAGDVR